VKKYLQITVVLITVLVAFYIKETKSSFQSKPTVLSIPSSPTQTVQRGKFKDGIYNGSIEDAIYGDLQVQATVSGGKLTDITELMFPNDNHTSIVINRKALEILRQEAIERQSAEVDIVTGASDSTPAFARSLYTALQQAL